MAGYKRKACRRERRHGIRGPALAAWTGTWWHGGARRSPSGPNGAKGVCSPASPSARRAAGCWRRTHAAACTAALKARIVPGKIYQASPRGARQHGPGGDGAPGALFLRAPRHVLGRHACLRHTEHKVAIASSRPWPAPRSSWSVNYRHLQHSNLSQGASHTWRP